MSALDRILPASRINLGLDLKGGIHLTLGVEVAKAVEMSARGYQDLELGVMPRSDKLLAIAEYYQVSIDWLMGRTDQREISR